MSTQPTHENLEAPIVTKTGYRRLIKTLSDWLELLQGPPSSVFREILTAKDWGRLLGLVTLSLTFSGVALGVNIGLSGLFSPTGALVSPKPLIYLLLTGALLSAVYSVISGLFRIRITLQETFFVLLSLTLPWLPVLIFIDAVRLLPSFPLISLVTLVGTAIVAFKGIANFVGGVREVSRSPKWRVWLSVLVPLAMIATLIFIMYG